MDESKRVGAASPVSGLTDLTQSKPVEKPSNPNQLDRSDFLNILVQQLKNQDPLEPMKNEEFAVNLAQFSQLEQLISINKNLSGGGTEGGYGVSSLAGYLGHEVLLDEKTLAFNGGNSDSLSVKLPQDTSGLFLELTKAGSSEPAKKIPLEGLSAGTHTVSLKGLGVPDGEYTYSVRGVGITGAEFAADAYVVGTVSGFVPGPEPKLVVGDREVDPSLVKQVRVPSA